MVSPEDTTPAENETLPPVPNGKDSSHAEEKKGTALSVSDTKTKNDDDNNSSTTTCEGKGLMMNRMAIDLIEFHCHKILVDNNDDLPRASSSSHSPTTTTTTTLSPLNHIGAYFKQLDHYLSLLKDNDECVYSNGRLNSRLNLVSLIYDVFSIHRCRAKDKSSSKTISPLTQQTKNTTNTNTCGWDQNNNFFSSRWQDKDWKRLEEQLALAKSAMLCKDANRCILPAETKSETENQKVQEEEKEDAQKKSLFEKDYQQLLCSLKVQAKIAKFYHSLEELQSQQQKKKASETDSLFMEQLARIIAEYATGLNKIFQDENEGSIAKVTDFNDQDQVDDGSDDENDDDDGENPSVSKTTKVLSDLVSFLLPVFYQKQNSSAHHTRLLLDRLMKHLETRIMNNPKCDFSYERVEANFRSLLHQWSNDVLDPPILVQRQHQQQQQEEQTPVLSEPSVLSSCSSLSDVQLDIASNTIADVDDDVSSWGGDDDGEWLLRSLELDEGQPNNTPTLAKSPTADEEDNRTIVTAVSASSSCYSSPRKDCLSLTRSQELISGSGKRKRCEEELAEDEPIPVVWLHNNNEVGEAVNVNATEDAPLAKYARRISSMSTSMPDF